MYRQAPHPRPGVHWVKASCTNHMGRGSVGAALFGSQLPVSLLVTTNINIFAFSSSSDCVQFPVHQSQPVKFHYRFTTLMMEGEAFPLSVFALGVSYDFVCLFVLQSRCCVRCTLTLNLRNWPPTPNLTAGCGGEQGCLVFFQELFFSVSLYIAFGSLFVETSPLSFHATLKVISLLN